MHLLLRDIFQGKIRENQVSEDRETIYFGQEIQAN